MNQPQSPNQPYFAAFKSEFSGIQVKYNPFLANRLAFTCAQNFGIVGKGKLIILDLLPDHQMKPVKILEHKDAVFDCSWAEVNQKLILSGCGNGEILLWDVDLEKVVSQLNGHVGEVQTLECSHKNQNLLLSAGIDSNIIVWDFLQGKQLQTLQKSHMKGIYQTTWHPNNQNLFASVGADGMLKIWDLKSEMNQKLVAGIKAHIGDVLSCDFSKYDEIIATASTDKSIKLWDLRKLQIPVHVLQGHRYPVRKIKFSPHQPNILASGSYDMNVNIWNTEEKLKPLLITHKQHTEFVIGIDFNLFQEKQIATAGWDGRVLVWDCEIEKKEDFRQEIEASFNKLGNDEKLILLLDGFDEFGEEKEKILELVGIKQGIKAHSNLKVIVSCRITELTEDQQREIFGVQRKDLSTEVGYICSVQSEQMHEYIRKFVDIVNRYKDSKLFGKFNAFQTYQEYKEMLDRSQALQDMATEPFTIRLLVGIMPDIKDRFKNQSHHHIRITLLEVLSIFTSKWIENEMSRLNADERYILAENITGVDLNQLEEKIPESVAAINRETLKIIEYLWIKGQINNNNFTYEDLQAICNQFEVELANISIVIKCLPIIINSVKGKISYGFFHKSISNYFLTQLWLQDFGGNTNANDANQEYYCQDKILKLQDLEISKCLITQSELMSLTILANYVLESTSRGQASSMLYKQFVNICLQILDLSKQDGFSELNGSSNAASILNFLKFSFSGLDLSKIKIKNANLDQAILSDTNLSYALLEGTVLARTNLNGCNLEGAQLKNVFWGVPKPDLLGHEYEITQVALSPDGKFIVSGSYYPENAVRIWEYATGAHIRTLTGHTQFVSSVAITPDGKSIVSGSGDKTIKVWNFATGTEIRTLVGHSLYVNQVIITPDGKKIVSGCVDSTIKIWNLENGSLISTLIGHQLSISSLAVSSDGKFVVSSSGDETIKMWNLEQNSLIKSLSTHGTTECCLGISKDGKLLVSGGRNGTITILNLENEREIRCIETTHRAINTLVITQDTKYIVSGNQDNTISIWNFESGKEIATLTGHSGSISSIILSLDERQIISGSQDKTIKIWNFDTITQNSNTVGHVGQVNQVVIHPNNRFIISGGEDKHIKVWNCEVGTELMSLAGHSQEITQLIISSDGKWIFSGSRDQSIMVWNFEEGTLLKKLNGQQSAITSMALSQDGKILVSSGETQIINLWDIQQGVITKSLSGQGTGVNSVALSSNGKYLVAGGNFPSNSIQIWNLDTEKVVQSLSGCMGNISALAIASNSKFVFSGAYRDIDKWDIDSGSQILKLSGHESVVRQLALSSDEKYLVSGGEDSQIKLWNLEKGTEIRTLKGHGQWVNSVALSSDCRFLVSGSRDQRIIVWGIYGDIEQSNSQNKKEEQDLVVEDESAKKYKIFFGKSNKILIQKIGLEEVVEQEKKNENHDIDVSALQQQNTQNKDLMNLIWFGSSKYLVQRVIERNLVKYGFIRSIQKDPLILSCNGINIKDCTGLSQIELKILAQRSGQNFDEIIKKTMF